MVRGLRQLGHLYTSMDVYELSLPFAPIQEAADVLSVGQYTLLFIRKTHVHVFIDHPLCRTSN